jgi:hypothetical protein
VIVVSPKAITVQKILRRGGGVPLIVDMEYVKLIIFCVIINKTYRKIK